jgi:[acyl-carrier-protein] S-malonyltransferase
MKLAMVFPGQGSQSVGMLKAYAGLPEVDAVRDEASAALGAPFLTLLDEGPAEQLNLTVNTQPAMVTAAIAAYRAWRALGGPAPAIVAGHSLGEYSALVASGVLRFADAVHLVHKRGVFMQEAVPPGAGSMAALLGVARQDVEALCAELGGGGVLQPANYNDPGQIVIAGETARVQAAVDAVKARRLGKPVLLKVSAPFHCRMLQPAAERLAHAFAQVMFHPFTVPVLSNVTAAPHPAPETVQDLLVQQVCAPVRWEDAMRYAVTHGCDALLEVGPGKTLSGMMKRIAPQVEILALDTFLRQ